MYELTGIAFSHYVEKARWALHRFAIPYRDHKVLPFLHMLAVYRIHRGQAGSADVASSRFSTPVLRTGDGQVLCDSAQIVRYLSERYGSAQTQLYHSPQASELEQHFHDRLGPHTRRVAYDAFFAQPELLHQVAAHNVSRAQALTFRAAYPLAKRGLARFLGVDAQKTAHSVARVRSELDAVSARLGDGRRFLLGDRFTAADLAFACLAAPAVLPPEYSAWLPPLDAFAEPVRARTLELRETPAGQFVMRLFAEERWRVLA